MSYRLASEVPGGTGVRTKDNPMGRAYTRAEVAAAKRCDLEGVDGGPLIWACGPYWPTHARKAAEDWKLVADAMEREWGGEHEVVSAG